MAFHNLLEEAQRANQSTLAISLAPTLNKLPLEIQRYDDPFLPFGKAVIDATADLVCAYVFHLGAYLGLGAAGAVALERTIAYVPAPAIKILHGPFGNDEYVRAAFERGFGANAVTIGAFGDSQIIMPYLKDKEHGAFVPPPVAHWTIPFESLQERYPGQIGIYNENIHFILPIEALPAEKHLYVSWQGEKITSASQGADFREAMHLAAESLRQVPIPDTLSKMPPVMMPPTTSETPSEVSVQTRPPQANPE